ncbi:MAG: DUF3794 domain-containing protein [Clostridia bacterium]|nr:DUF3794 domain-containing protein [Clostridia bacterium]
MEIIKEQVRASQFMGHKSLVELVEGDIIVPDIKPDILSLVKVEGRAFITDKETLDKKVRLSGMVDVYAIYIADDETNSLKGLSAALNFNETIDMPNCESGMEPIVKYSLGNIESKVLNGRKITVKCPIEIDLKIMKDQEFEISRDISDADNIQVLKEEIKLNSLVGYNTEDVSINETVSLPENNLPIGEILCCSVDIVNKDYKMSYNKVLAKADAKVRIVYIADDENGTIQTFETLIPFTGFIDINGVNDNTEFDINYNLKNYYIKPVYQDMKANAISVEADVEIFVLANEVREVVAIQDLYNPDEVLRYDVRDVAIDQNVNTQTTNVRLDQVLSIPELENSKLLDVNVRTSITDKKVLDDKIVVEGNANVDITHYHMDKRTIETKKLELPFQETVPIDRNNSQNDVTLEVADVEYELMPSGQLRLNIGLALENDAVNELNIHMIDNLEQTNERLEPVASVVIYPVKQGDTLWKIAKRFRTTVEAIKEANDLTDDKIYPSQQLMIPKRIYRVTLNPLD